ncbi:MAG: tRNA (N6-threonylcarbamoyladenosine(37)-N6)-methyltransferase TrmO, partial [Candidatus Hadarchaeum sp.]
DTIEQRQVLQVIPKRHPGAPLVGVFASRSPTRPNPIGMCVVELIRVENCRLRVKGLDAVEGSPIVDIKPYLPRADSVPGARAPEWTSHGPTT